MNRVVTFLLLITLALPSSAMGGKQRRLQRKAARQAAKCVPVGSGQWFESQSLVAGDFFTDACGNEFYVDACCQLISILNNPVSACPEVNLGSAPGGLCLWLVNDCNDNFVTMVSECHDPCPCTDGECPNCPWAAKPGDINAPPLPIDNAATRGNQKMRPNHRRRIRRKQLLIQNFADVQQGDVTGVSNETYIAKFPGEEKYFALYTFTRGLKEYRFALRSRRDLSRDVRKSSFTPLTVSGKPSKQEGRLIVEGVEYHLFGRFK